MRLGHLTAAILIFCSASAASYGRDAEFTLTIGASQLSEGPLQDQWGPFVEPSFSLSPFDQLPQLRLGGGLEFAYFTDDFSLDFFGAESSVGVELFLFTPEALISWRQPLGDHFYIEPGVGVGGVIGAVYAIGTEWAGGYSVRPFVRIAYQTHNLAVGVDAGYRFGQLDFGDGDVDLQNFNIGAFVAFTL